MSTAQNKDNLNLDLKYRPKELMDIVGNSENITCLSALMANTKKIPKFFMFTGPPGSGKTTTGYIVARMLSAIDTDGNRISDKNKLDNLQEISYNKLYIEGTTDVMNGIYIFDIGVSSDLEFIQSISNNIRREPLGKQRKILIIDELQMIKGNQQDPLLKALEYVADGVHVIITTSEPRKINQALKDRVDVALQFTYPSFEEAYTFCRGVLKEEKIKINSSVLKQVITSNKNNLRKIMKALSILKVDPVEGLKIIVQDKEERYNKIIDYFEKCNENIIDLLVFIESLESQSEFVKELPIFIKDYIKASYTRQGITKKFRDRLLDVMRRYKEDTLVDIMTESINLFNLTEDRAETYLIALAYKLNSNLRVESTQPDSVIIKSKEDIINKNSEVEVESRDLTPSSVFDSVGIDLNQIVKDIGIFKDVESEVFDDPDVTGYSIAKGSAQEQQKILENQEKNIDINRGESDENTSVNDISKQNKSVEESVNTTNNSHDVQENHQKNESSETTEKIENDESDNLDWFIKGSDINLPQNIQEDDKKGEDDGDADFTTGDYIISTLKSGLGFHTEPPGTISNQTHKDNHSNQPIEDDSDDVGDISYDDLGLDEEGNVALFSIDKKQ